MKKFNLKKVITSILQEFRNDGTIKKYSTDYPKEWNTYPLIIYRTTSKPNFVDNYGNELRTRWSITLEIYHNKSVSEITEKLVERFRKANISLSQKDSNASDFSRCVLDAEFIIDNTLNIIYDI